MATDLDHSYIGTYLEDWLQYVRESNRAEQQILKESQEFYVPYAGLQLKILQLIFDICKQYEIGLHAKYMAIHIFDRYWIRLFWEIYSSHKSPSSSPSTDIPESVAQQVQEKMKSQLKIAIAVSVQIASKVDLFKTALCLTQIHELLQSIDKEREHTKASICKYELRVLKVLDYRLPHNLPINVIELFLELEKLDKPELRDTCFKLLDVAYFYHNELFEQMFLLAHGKQYDRSDPKAKFYLRLEANAPFMAASVVVCCCYFHLVKRKYAERMASRLSKLIDMNPVDMIIMANILQNFVIHEKDYQTLRERQAQKVKKKAEQPPEENASNAQNSNVDTEM